MRYETISNKILYKLVEEKQINNEYHEVYSYALEKLLAGIGNAILLLLTALIFDIGIETIVFLAFYMPIRKYAGGLHAKTRTQCVVISLISMISMIKLAMVISNTSIWSSFTLVTLSIVILVINQFAPMDSANKRLSSKYWIKHKIISKNITVAESLILIAGILFAPELKVYIMTAAMAMLLVGITIIPYKKNGGFKLWKT